MRPDGSLELDFEVAAGVQPDDDESAIDRKMKIYYAKQAEQKKTQAEQKKTAGATMIGGAAFIAATYFGVDHWQAIWWASLVGWGLRLML
jgi:hypothetical protein